MGRALAGTPPEGERLAFDAAGYLAGLPGDTAALLIAGEVPLPAAADGAAADRAPTEAGPPALTIGYLLLDQKKQPVVRGPVPPVEAPPGPAGAAPSRIVFSGAVDGLAPDTYTLRVAATDSRGRVGLVEREIVLKATGTGGASAGDVLIGRIEPDRSVTLIPGALDVADTIFLQWEAVAEGAATGRFRIAPAGGGATVLTVPAEIELRDRAGRRAAASGRRPWSARACSRSAISRSWAS